MGEKLQNDSLDNKDSNNPPATEDNNSADNNDQMDDINEDDLDPEEFQRLDNQLNALFTALDDIESKNDNIHAQLLELLQANRDIRKQLHEANQNESENKPEDMDTGNS